LLKEGEARGEARGRFFCFQLLVQKKPPFGGFTIFWSNCPKSPTKAPDMTKYGIIYISRTSLNEKQVQKWGTFTEKTGTKSSFIRIPWKNFWERKPVRVIDAFVDIWI
jgi:hypothetical protein